MYKLLWFSPQSMHQPLSDAAQQSLNMARALARHQVAVCVLSVATTKTILPASVPVPDYAAAATKPLIFTEQAVQFVYVPTTVSDLNELPTATQEQLNALGAQLMWQLQPDMVLGSSWDYLSYNLLRQAQRCQLPTAMVLLDEPVAQGICALPVTANADLPSTEANPAAPASADATASAAAPTSATATVSAATADVGGEDGVCSDSGVDANLALLSPAERIKTIAPVATLVLTTLKTAGESFTALTGRTAAFTGHFLSLLGPLRPELLTPEERPEAVERSNLNQIGLSMFYQYLGYNLPAAEAEASRINKQLQAAAGAKPSIAERTQLIDPNKRALVLFIVAADDTLSATDTEAVSKAWWLKLLVRFAVNNSGSGLHWKLVVTTTKKDATTQQQLQQTYEQAIALVNSQAEPHPWGLKLIWEEVSVEVLCADAVLSTAVADDAASATGEVSATSEMLSTRVKTLLQDARVVILPQAEDAALNWWALQAMSFGAAVTTSNTPWSREMLGDKIARVPAGAVEKWSSGCRLSMPMYFNEIAIALEHVQPEADERRLLLALQPLLRRRAGNEPHLFLNSTYDCKSMLSEQALKEALQAWYDSLGAAAGGAPA